MLGIKGIWEGFLAQECSEAAQHNGSLAARADDLANQTLVTNAGKSLRLS